MKINIILPYNTWSGAFRSTYELANNMVAMGKDVVIYMPFSPYLTGVSPLSWNWVKSLIRGVGRSAVRWNRVPWFDLKATVKIVPRISNRFIRDADTVLANHWPTAFSVAKLSPKKGKKFYLIRDAKKSGLNTPLLEEVSFRLPLTRIVTTSMLKDHLAKEVGVTVAGIVTNGTNVKDFSVSEKKYNDPPVICMTYYVGATKGIADGFAVLQEVKRRHPRVKILMFGWEKPKKLPFEAEFHQQPVKEKLRAIYARSDIFLSPSLKEGYHNPPREAMSAQCAVVATNAGSIPHCAIPGETALVVAPGDVKGMVEAICSLVENPDRIPRLGRRAFEHISQFTWQKATTDLLQLFEEGRSS